MNQYFLESIKITSLKYLKRFLRGGGWKQLKQNKLWAATLSAKQEEQETQQSNVDQRLIYFGKLNQ